MTWPHQVLGDVAAPPVLFLHGFLGSGADWLPVAGPLSRDYFCILPDLPGHAAHTQIPFDEPLTFDGLSAGIGDLLDELSIPQVNVVGYSLGGRAALHFACTQPARVRALILESASPGIEDAMEREKRAALDDERASTLLRVGLEAFVDVWYAAPLWGSLRRKPALLAQVKAQRAGQEARWMAKVVRELSPGRMPSLWGSLPLVGPALLLAGEEDAHYAGLIPRMASLISKAEFQIITDAGHNLHVEEPGLFLSVISAFLYNSGNIFRRQE